METNTPIEATTISETHNNNNIVKSTKIKLTFDILYYCIVCLGVLFLFLKLIIFPFFLDDFSSVAASAFDNL
jgi:hypothetical protein